MSDSVKGWMYILLYVPASSGINHVKYQWNFIDHSTLSYLISDVCTLECTGERMEISTEEI